MQRTSSGLSKAERLQKLRLNHSAIIVQALIRGKLARLRCQQNRPHVKQVVQKPAMNELETTQLAATSELVANNDPLVAQAIENDDEDAMEREIVEDPEEVAINNAALAEEERLLSDRTQLLASRESVQLEWPSPFIENLDDFLRPPINDDCEQWVFHHKCIYMRVVTWNLCAKPPPAVEDVQRILLPKERFHIYVIGTEECERSIAQSAINPSKKTWEGYLSTAIGPRYVPIRSHTLQAIHLMMFAHESIAYHITEIVSASVATGVGNTLGNKGGVGISFRIGETKIVVVNAHLAAHDKAVKQRNADFAKINHSLPPLLEKKILASTLSLSGISTKSSKIRTSSKDDIGPSTPHSTATVSSERDDFKLSKCADRVIFMGDLNYRIRGNRRIVDSLLASNMHHVLLENDQLTTSMRGNQVLHGFKEPELRFKPTYKFDINSDVYDSGSKKRIPAWTDRILHTEAGITCLAYDSVMSLSTSDHKPIYASFKIDVQLNPEEIDDTPQISGDASAVALSRKSTRIVTDRPKFQSESEVCSLM